MGLDPLFWTHGAGNGERRLDAEVLVARWRRHYRGGTGAQRVEYRPPAPEVIWPRAQGLEPMPL